LRYQTIYLQHPSINLQNKEQFFVDCGSLIRRWTCQRDQCFLASFQCNWIG